MKKMIEFLFLSVLIISISACDKSEGYSLNDYWVRKATIENPKERKTFFLVLDDGTRLFTTAKSQELYYYTPKDSQRVIANFTILHNVNEEKGYKYDVKLNGVSEMLTKPIFTITPATEDSIGNDPITIEKIELVGDFLDIKFSYWGANEMHYINLVQEEATGTPSDSVSSIKLEFRHNANKDPRVYRRKAWASFKLRSLNNFPTQKTKLLIDVKESTSKKSTYEIEYDPKNQSLPESSEEAGLALTELNIL